MSSSGDRWARAWAIIRSWHLVAAIAAVVGLGVLNHFANLPAENAGPNQFARPGWDGVLIRGVAPEIIGTLLIYIAINWLLRRQRELFDESAVEHIGDKVAERVFSRKKSTFDDTLQEKSSDSQIIREARNEIWLAQRTGLKLFREAREPLVEHLQSERKIRLITTSPNSVGSRHAFFGRNDLATPSALSQFAADARNRLDDIFRKCREAQKLVELRYCPYALPASVVLTDPRTMHGLSRLNYKLNGFFAKLSDQDEIALETESDVSPLFIDSVKTAYEEVFSLSSKVVVLPLGQNCRSRFESIVPEFWGRSLENNTGEIRSEESSNVFIVWFEEPSPPQYLESRVRFGLANEKSKGRNFTRSDTGGQSRIDPDCFRVLLTSLEKAIDKKKVIIFGNLGPLELGAVEDRSRIQVVPERLEDGTASREFYLDRVKQGEVSVTMTLSVVIGKLLDDVDSHVFLDLRNDPAVTSSAIYRRIMNHERTTRMIAEGFPDSLQSELEGSIQSVSFSQEADCH